MRTKSSAKVLTAAITAFMLISLMSVTAAPVGAKDIDVSPPEYETIQEAIDAAEPGDTIIVAEGTYYENIVIDKPLTLKSADGPEKTVINGGGGTVIEIKADNVTVEGFTLVNGGYVTLSLDGVSNCTVANNVVGPGETMGIVISYSNSCTVDNNVSSSNGTGIFLGFSSNNTIINNICNFNDKGISLNSSKYNTIDNNTCESNSSGIFLDASSNNTMTNNICKFNEGGIMFWGSSPFAVIKNNTCDSNGMGIALTDGASLSMVENNTCRNGDLGILLYRPGEKCTVKNNTCENNGVGIVNLGGDNCTVSNNNTTGNGIGIILIGSSNGTVSNNISTGNMIGIGLALSTNNEVSNNSFGNNWIIDAYLFVKSSNNQVSNNSFGNDSIGILICEGLWEGLPDEIKSIWAGAGVTEVGICENNSIHYNDIVGEGVGLLNEMEDYTVDATLNWWGTECGDEIAKMISGDVDFYPWLDAARNTLIDNTPPENFELTWPENEAMVSNWTPTLTWVEPSDDISGVDHYEVWIDGTNVGSAETNSFTTSELSEDIEHTWYVVAVDRAGNDTKSENTFSFTVRMITVGTGKLFENIQDAIDNAIPGDIVLVYPGTYDENLTVNVENLTLRSTDGAENTSIEGPEGTKKPTLTISADGVTVSGFTIRSGRDIEPAWTIVVQGDSALLTDLHVIKENCYWPTGSPKIEGAAVFVSPSVDGFAFTDSTVDSEWNGIYAPRNPDLSPPGSSNIVVRNVDFTYPGEYGIGLMMVTGATIEGNTFTVTGHENPKADSNGIYITKGSNAIEVEGNQFIGSQCLTARNHIGILLQAYATGTMGNVDILGNDIGGFNIGILVEDVDTSGISINWNNIEGNLEYGVQNIGSNVVDATLNWWGHESGPDYVGLGTGDFVSANVDYSPWLDADGEATNYWSMVDELRKQIAALGFDIETLNAKIEALQTANDDLAELLDNVTTELTVDIVELQAVVENIGNQLTELGITDNALRGALDDISIKLESIRSDLEDIELTPGPQGEPGLQGEDGAIGPAGEPGEAAPTEVVWASIAIAIIALIVAFVAIARKS